ALIAGQIVLEDFENDNWDDETTRAVMRRIHAAPHPSMAADGAEYLGAEVKVTYDDGRIFEEKIGAALGRGPDNPLPAEALSAKFANCAARALPKNAIEPLAHILMMLDEAPSLRAVAGAIAVPPPV